MGRVKQHWKGQHYPQLNQKTNFKRDGFQYHVLLSEEVNEDKENIIVPCVIPLSWFDQSLQYFLYPPQALTAKSAGATNPLHWSNQLLTKHACPGDDWVEYSVSNIVTKERGTGMIVFHKLYFIRPVFHITFLSSFSPPGKENR